ncbi:MAG: N-acetylneuraminate synthase family protein [Patescibacteria group bacterium]|nr:N-acetylneuraminate synthase family protein [Patescibacteria group bacterium]
MKDINKHDLKNNLKRVASAPGRFRMGKKGWDLNPNDFMVIAGPCRVESKKQMTAVAQTLRENHLKLIRAGAYKPATFPYSPPGLGKKGLKIIQDIAHQYDLISVSEVMAISEIPLAKQYIDVFQVGARNMQNYDLLATIGKTRKPVLLKRHPGASLRDFLGAAEWLLYYGCQDLVLCERGVTAPYTHDPNARWLLDITIVPAIKRISKLPIILDVSHSCGVREFIPSLTAAATASGADGMMVEIHPEPRESKSDPNQTVSLKQFCALLKKVKKIAQALDKKVV